MSPDSGTPAALGFAEASGIPFGEGLIKNRYIQRTFIQPDQRMREMGVRMKLTPIREALQGKSVVMVDDTIVRGTTTGKVVRLLLEAGAREVHVRISAPPVKWPCFYGIDMATQDQLIAASQSVEAIRQKIGATSLGYLTEAGLARAMSSARRQLLPRLLHGQLPHPRPGEPTHGKARLRAARELMCCPLPCLGLLGNSLAGDSPIRRGAFSRCRDWGADPEALVWRARSGAGES